MNALKNFHRACGNNSKVLSSKLLKIPASSIFSKRRNHIKPEEAREIRIPFPNGYITG